MKTNKIMGANHIAANEIGKVFLGTALLGFPVGTAMGILAGDVLEIFAKDYDLKKGSNVEYNPLNLLESFDKLIDKLKKTT